MSGLSSLVAATSGENDELPQSVLAMLSAEAEPLRASYTKEVWFIVKHGSRVASHTIRPFPRRCGRSARSDELSG